MKFIVLEVQTNANGTVGNLVTAYDDRNLAESNYHKVLMNAAISSLPTHTAFLLTNEGQVIKTQTYTHRIESEESIE